MKRSHAPIFWLLFGGGGMLAALVGVALVFITGLAAPLGIGMPADALNYTRVLAWARHPVGKLLLFGVVMLFAWHAAHRILCTLHDLGMHKGLPAKLACYGSAGVITLVAAYALIAIGM
jgi:fumarate reductase subunit D